MKITKDSYWIKSGAFSFLQNITTLFLGFGGFYLLVRLVDKPDFGAWSLFVTVAAICEVARVGFIKYGFIKFWNSEGDTERGKIFTASLALNIAFAVFVGLGMLLLGETLANSWDTPQLKELFYIYAFTNIVLIPFFQFEFLQQAVLDFRAMFYAYFVRNGFLFLSIAAGHFKFYTLSLTSLAWSHLIGAFLGSIMAYLVVRDRLVFTYQFEWVWIKKIFHFGKYVVGTSLSAMLYSAVDQFMLGSMVSTASVAIYNATGRITNLINVPSVTVTSVLFPRSAQVMATEGKEAVKILYEKSVGAILGVVLPAVVFVSIFPSWIITIIAGDTYLDAVPILKVIILVSLFMPFAYQFGTILDSIGKPRINFYTTAISLVVNASVNYYLISLYGIMGAVWGSLGVAVARFVVMQVILYRQIGTSPLRIPTYTVLFYIGLVKGFRNLIWKKLGDEAAAKEK